MKLFLPCLAFILGVLCVYSRVEAALNASGDVPLNLFEVDGELKALPEVASNLNFEKSPFPTNLEEQLAIRDAHYWGRMYVEGWPAPIQYFRAHFGTPPPSGAFPLLFAHPPDLCDSEEDVNSMNVDNGTPIVVVQRGGCSFERKVTEARKRVPNLKAVLVVNDKDGLEHLASPQIHDIDLFVGLISEDEGRQLRHFHDLFRPSPSLKAALVPILCAQHPETKRSSCEPITEGDKQAMASLDVSGGYLDLEGGENVTFEFLQAHFGVAVPTLSQPMQLATAFPLDACEPLQQDAASLLGRLVMARRGGCPCVTKAQNVQAAGGLALIVGGHDMTLRRPGVEPRWQGLEINIPVMITTKAFFDKVQRGGSDLAISVRRSSSISSKDWDEVSDLHEGQGWPRSESFRQKKVEELKSRFEGSWEKLQSLEEGLSKVEGEKTRQEL
jgi:hypothetical protein